MKLTFKLVAIIIAYNFVLASANVDIDRMSYNRSQVDTKTDKSSGIEIPLSTVTVQLSFADSTNAINDDVMPEVKISTALKNTTAFEILQLAAKRNPCYNFNYKTNEFGRHITSICCRAENTTTKLHWFFYINNLRWSNGVDQLKPQHGDVLRFEYRFNNSTEGDHEKSPPGMQNTGEEPLGTACIKSIAQDTGFNPTGVQDIVPQISVFVKLIFTTYLSSNAIPAQRVVTANRTTAFEILRLAAKTHPCYNFRYKTFSIGRSIESICCVKKNMTTHFYWFIYINGKLSPVGVDLLRPKDGDTLTFKYEEWKFKHSNHATQSTASTQLPTTIVFTATPTGKGQKTNALPVNAYILLIIAISWTLLVVN